MPDLPELGDTVIYHGLNGDEEYIVECLYDDDSMIQFEGGGCLSIRRVGENYITWIPKKQKRRGFGVWINKLEGNTEDDDIPETQGSGPVECDGDDCTPSGSGPDVPSSTG